MILNIICIGTLVFSAAAWLVLIYNLATGNTEENKNDKV